MNTQSNAMPESFGSQGTAPATMSATRPMYWAIRREVSEYRSIYIAPLAVAGLALLGFLIATIGRAMASPSLAQRRAVLEEPYHFATALILGSAFIVGFFYSLDALHGERRDRSILFWKSLPVSDFTTVLAKASIPVVILPLLSFGIVVATHLIMLLMSSAVLLGSGVSVTPLWTRSSSFLMALLYHLVTVHMLWYAPIYGWLLLVSGWARRMAFLWAGLPLLAIGVVEKIAFNTIYFATWLRYRFTGPEAFDLPGHGSPAMGSMTHLSLGTFLSTPGLWLGLAVAAVFLAAAIRQRRYQGPI
ncbi:MAG: ABC transporter permease [Acidobacteriia bacterium]|nr:ABC transporter permease [Terriglobia bacterium]